MSTYISTIKENPGKFLATVIIIICIFSVVDIFEDLESNMPLGHIEIESSMIIACLFCLYFIKEFFYKVHEENILLKTDAKKSEQELIEWKTNSSALTKGLSEQIDTQFLRWNFSQAEEEIARLLLKGLSVKEIATIRGTTEKTTRQQTVSIYSKAGLAGRAELSAFFLEDLLFPQKNS